MLLQVPWVVEGEVELSVAVDEECEGVEDLIICSWKYYSVGKYMCHRLDLYDPFLTLNYGVDQVVI